MTAVALAVAACGTATPTDSTEPKPGGTVTGRYLLQLKPSSRCAAAQATATVPVVVTRTASDPHPGVQLIVDGADGAQLELELKYTDFVLEGALATTGNGVRSNEAQQVWVNGIGTGKTTRTSDGRGEVVSGSVRGYLEIEGMSGCDATDHSFTLRAR